ncbi:serine phosphatase [Desulfovibrio sp. X2]|uniref:SpoIIE family protein phosphatase n=1 Tax=Desulfovibrio sp. X2 TaxID=941449 RepID=UPI00035880D6|nr:SpoIIE family protein phosphatase [Desulfovibrio sp. X2]EPR37680.1 serine phosphatase [Desulfovibrio sp. X2]
MKIRLPFQSSFRAQFNLTVAVVYLLAAVATLTAFAFAMQSLLTDYAARNTVKEALLERNRAAAVIDRELVLARTLASDPAVRRWVRDESDPELRARAFEQLDNYRDHFRDRSFFVAIAKSGDYYLDNRSHGAAHLDGTRLNPANPADAWFYRDLRSERGYELYLDYDVAAQTTKIWLNVVITDDKGRPIGLGGSGIDVSDFVSGLVASQEKGLTTLLTDANGAITASADRALVERNARIVDPADRVTVYSMVDNPEDRERLRLAIADATEDSARITAFPLSMTGGRAMVAVSVLPGTGWRNIVVFDVSGLYTSRVFLPGVAIIIVSLLSVLAVISMFINRRVLRPLTGLTKAARQMARGRYDVALPVERSDEIGQLAGSFNSMAATVQDHTQNLEQKVDERTSELSAANAELSRSRASIMESLRYARAIQATLLPRPEDLARAFSDHMVLYRPRDLVGGDLVFLRRNGERSLFAVLDCTGHGVPGAFMAMTAHSLLHRAAAGLSFDDPAAILAETDRLLRLTYRLNEEGEGMVDCGLEAALCSYERGSGKVVFAGARLSLYAVEGGEVREVRGDRQRIGYRGPALKAPFTNHVVEAGPKTRFFAATDGVLDEAGGERGFGFGLERFLAVLTESGDAPLAATATALDETLRAYRGEHPQRDDIAVIGFRL